MLVDSQQQGPGPQLKVLGFGIALLIDDQFAANAPPGRFMRGPFPYESPERLESGHEIDGRSDIYSTGIMLYRLLTGRLPFEGGMRQIVQGHLSKSPPTMRKANPKVKVPPGVEHVVMRCLEKDLSRRPQTARELAEAFSSAICRPRRQGNDAEQIRSSRGWYRDLFRRLRPYRTSGSR